MAIITINELIIEKKPLKETNQYGKQEIIFFGSEIKMVYDNSSKKYDKQEKKYYKFVLLGSSQYTQEIENKIMSLHIGTCVNIMGEVWGAKEISKDNNGCSVVKGFMVIKPTKIQTVSEVKEPAPKEEIVQDDEIPF